MSTPGPKRRQVHPVDVCAGCDTKLYTHSRVLVQRTLQRSRRTATSRYPTTGRARRRVDGTRRCPFTFFQLRSKIRLREPAEHSVLRTRAFGRLNVRRVRIHTSRSPLFCMSSRCRRAAAGHGPGTAFRSPNRVAIFRKCEARAALIRFGFPAFNGPRRVRLWHSRP